MAVIERSALVPFSDRQMYDLINDVERYPEFMAGCVGAKVLRRGEGWLEARLDLARAGFRQSVITRNTLQPPRAMALELVDGPFSRFDGEWRFEALNVSACRVTFRLDFAFSSKILSFAATKLFEQVASDQVSTLCQRARQIYA